MILRRIGLIAFFGALMACALSALAQTPPSPPPEKVDQLIKLLADPTVKEWLSQQVQAPPPPASAAPEAPSQQGNAQGMQPSMVSSMLERIKQHLESLAMAWPRLPAK